MRDQVEILTNQNDQLREAANVAVKERDKLQQENTSVKFQMSDMEIKLEKSENSKGLCLSKCVSHSLCLISRLTVRNKSTSEG